MIKNLITEDDIKKWIASFSKEDWLKKLEEEKHLYEINKLKNSEWLNFKEEARSINLECVGLTSVDKRNFTWTSFDPKLETVSYKEVETIDDFDIEAA